MRKIFYTKEIDYKLHDLRNNHKNVALKLADGCDSFTLAAVVKINVYLLIQIWRRKKYRNEKKKLQQVFTRNQFISQLFLSPASTILSFVVSLHSKRTLLTNF